MYISDFEDNKNISDKQFLSLLWQLLNRNNFGNSNQPNTKEVWSDGSSDSKKNIYVCVFNQCM